MKRALISSLVIAASAATLTGCFEIAEADTFTVDRQMSWDGIREIDLETINGRVEVEATGDGEEVSLYVRLEIPEDVDPDTVLSIDSRGETLVIREDWPKRLFFRDSSDASYFLRVPPETSVDISSTNGRLTSRGVNGEQKLTSVNGRIEIETPSSQVSASTVNGSIEAVFHERFTGASMRTVNGSVKLRVPADTELRADVSQVNGSFNSEIPLIVGGDQDGVPMLDVTTVNGSIRVGKTRSR